MALQRVWIASPNYHGRNTSGVRLIVLHTAEGATTIESLGNFFANPANEVSSHAGADDKLGKIGEYVKRGNASWTCANYNNVAVQIEMCGFASWSTDNWKNNHHNMLKNCADWIREESQYFGIPITKLNASQAQGSGRGVCQHRDLGAGGGGHTDCGNGFPMDYVLDLARGGGSTPPPSETAQQEAEIMLMNKGTNANTPVAFISASKIGLFSDATARVRIDWRPSGIDAGDVDVSLDGGSTKVVNFPNNKVKGIRLIRLDGGSNDVSYVLS